MRNMTKRRRMLMVSASAKSRLPTGFREVQWLQGSGTQYCQTDIKPRYTSTFYTAIKGDITVLNKIESQFELMSDWWQNYSSVNSEFKYGIRYSYVHRLPQDTYNALVTYRYGYTNTAIGTVDFTNSVFPLDVHYEINKNNIIINQSTISIYSDIPYDATIQDRPLLIGANYTNYSAAPIAIFNKQTRVKTFYIYNDNTLLYEIVPCYRKSDNKTGFMKITVADGSTTFFPNLGEDEWIIGPVV